MKMAPGAIPNPGRVPKQELLSPELGFLVAAALGCVSGENPVAERVLGEKRAAALFESAARDLGVDPDRLEPSSAASRRLFAYIFTPNLKTSEHQSFSPKTHLCAAATKNPNSGDRSSCFGTLPGLGIAPRAIFIGVAASHDASGVVLHRR